MKRYQRRPRDEWQRLVTEQINSGQRASVFCRHREVSYASFIQWKKKLVDSDLTVPSSTDTNVPEFVEITPDRAPATVESDSHPLHTGPRVELDLGGGWQLRIFST